MRTKTRDIKSRSRSGKTKEGMHRLSLDRKEWQDNQIKGIPGRSKAKRGQEHGVEKNFKGI